MVREIEEDTFEENPALFREYMDASPELRAIMDNQFKNVKAHARLLSKEQWYQWRVQLLDGLKEGLLRIGEGLSEDVKVLAQQERLLKLILPGLVKEHEALESEVKLLQTQAEELASCDQEELSRARDRLLNVDLELEAKKQKLTALEQQQKDLDDTIGLKTQQKQKFIEEIKEAEKIQEECRGWSGSEVASLKGRSASLLQPIRELRPNIPHSRSRCPRRKIRLEYNLRIRQRLHILLPPRSPPLPLPLFLPRK